MPFKSGEVTGFDQYRCLIYQWTDFVNEKGITLTNGDPIPPVFWKTFFGISRSVHSEMINGTYRREKFSPALTRSIHLTQCMTEKQFLAEVRRTVPEFEKNKRK